MTESRSSRGSRRPREPRRSRRATGALVLVCLLLLLVALAALTYTPLFAARTIRVEGAGHLSPDAVVSLAGVSERTNVFHLDPSVPEAALEASPWIAASSVTRDLPSTLVILIEERTPVGVTDEGGVVAADGVSLPGAQPHDLPTIRASVGQLDDAGIAAAAAALVAMAPVVLGEVSAAIVAPDGTLTVALRDGVRVAYGTAGEEAQKAIALRAVLQWARAQGASLASVDVSVPDTPAATLADGTTVTP